MCSSCSSCIFGRRHLRLNKITNTRDDRQSLIRFCYGYRKPQRMTRPEKLICYLQNSIELLLRPWSISKANSAVYFVKHLGEHDAYFFSLKKNKIADMFWEFQEILVIGSTFLRYFRMGDVWFISEEIVMNSFEKGIYKLCLSLHACKARERNCNLQLCWIQKLV